MKPVEASPDLVALSHALASARFDASECLRRLVALAEADEFGPIAEQVTAPVQAIGAARRAEGRDAAGIRRVLDALRAPYGERSCARIFRALFGAPGRNSYFSAPYALSHTVPVALQPDGRWHELVVALETGDEDAQRAVVAQLSPLEVVCEGPHWWSLMKRIARIDEAPLPTQVRWILGLLPHRPPEARRAARSLARELDLRVPEDDATQSYSIAAVVALIANLPVGFPDWGDLFQQVILELADAHGQLGTTISEALGEIPWEAIADEREHDAVTLRRSFRGYEVRWTVPLMRFRSELEGRLACKRLARPLDPGSRWTALLDPAERDRCLAMAVEFGEVTWLAELLAEGVTLSERHVDKHRNVRQLQLMAPHLSPALRQRVLKRMHPRGLLSARPVLALLDHVAFTQGQLEQFARQGMTELFERSLSELSDEARRACLAAAEAACREGTAAVLRDAPLR